MGITDAYATPQMYRALLHSSDPGQDEDIQGDLLAITRYLERYLHVFFNKDDDLVTRYYTPTNRVRSPNPWYSAGGSGIGFAETENPWLHVRGEPILNIDPIADTTGMSIVVDTDRDGSYVGESPLSASDYILLPRNALVGPEPGPYTSISRPVGFTWVPGCEVKITAIWGWPAVPKAIERATVHLTGILRIETPRATSRISEMDGTIAASKACQDILQSLAKTAYKRQLPV